jgi:periplasmic protein TonB
VSVHRDDELRLALPIGAAVLLHASAIAALVALKSGAPMALPPIYKVNIVAAPPGPSAIGVVKPKVEAPEAPVPPRAEKLAPAPSIPITTKKAPAKAPPKEVTPTPPVPAPRTQPAAPAAGGGATGGKGTDVANVRTEGIDFPFPGYLNNIVRQIKVRFNPPPGTQRAEIMFILHRDGSVSNLRFLTRSGSYEFDLEAQGAVEAAAGNKAFGPLPEGFPEDALPIVFSFDPRLLGR